MFAALALIVVTLVGAPAQAATSWLSGHVQDIGWRDSTPSIVVDDAVWVGTVDTQNRIEALRLNDPAGAVFTMKGHVQNVGWVSQQRLPDGRVMVGTTGKSLRLEAVQLFPISPLRDVWCQAFVAGKGWLEPQKNGGTCGTTGESRKMLTLRIWIRPTEGEPTTPPTTPPVEVDPVLSTVSTVGDVGLEAQGRANLAAIGRSDATLALILGDLAYAPPAQAFCDTVKASIPGNVGWVQGNHENRDADKPGPDPAVNDSTPAYQACMPTTAGASGETGVQQVIQIPGARIITVSPQEIDGGYAPGSTRWTWTRDQIRAAQAAGDWPILAMHEPCETPGAHGCAGADSQALTDLAIAEHVPLFLAGHDHVYGRKAIGSTTFVVAGMGGHNPRTITAGGGWAVTNPGSAYGFVHLTIRAHSITGEFAGVDRFEVTR